MRLGSTWRRGEAVLASSGQLNRLGGAAAKNAFIRVGSFLLPSSNSRLLSHSQPGEAAPAACLLLALQNARKRRFQNSLSGEIRPFAYIKKVIFKKKKESQKENLGIERLRKKRLNQSRATLSGSSRSETSQHKILVKSKQFRKTFCFRHINISDGKPFCQKISLQLRARISYQTVLPSPQQLGLLIHYNEFP